LSGSWLAVRGPDVVTHGGMLRCCALIGATLGVPLMYVKPTWFNALRGHIDDAVILAALAFLNSLRWGTALAWVVRWIRSVRMPFNNRFERP
jgi:hypothetical protein